MDTRQPKQKTYTEEELERVEERNELLRKRLKDPTAKKMFRNAYCFKAGYDFSTLKPYCENVVMVADGYSEHIDIVRAKMELGLAEYDSDKDVVVMAGRAIDHLLVGQIITQKILEKPKAFQSYAVAVYYNSSYIFYQIYLDPTIETHEMIRK